MSRVTSTDFCRIAHGCGDGLSSSNPAFSQSRAYMLSNTCTAAKQAIIMLLDVMLRWLPPQLPAGKSACSCHCWQSRTRADQKFLCMQFSQRQHEGQSWVGLQAKCTFSSSVFSCTDLASFRARVSGFSACACATASLSSPTARQPRAAASHLSTTASTHAPSTNQC